MEFYQLTNKKVAANRSSLVLESKHSGTKTDTDQKHNLVCRCKIYCLPLYVSITGINSIVNSNVETLWKKFKFT